MLWGPLSQTGRGSGGRGGEDERERRKERKGVVTGNMKRGRGSGMVQEVGGGEVW